MLRRSMLAAMKTMGARFVASSNAQAHCLELMRRYDNENYIVNVLSDAGVRRAHAAIRAFNAELVLVRARVSNEDAGRVRMAWFRAQVDVIVRGGGGAGAPSIDALAEMLDMVGVGGGEEARDLVGRELRQVVDGRDAELLHADYRTVGALEHRLLSTHGAMAAMHMHVLCANKGVKADDMLVDIARKAGLTVGLVVALRGAPALAMERQSVMPSSIATEVGVARAALLKGGTEAAPVFQRVAALAHKHLKAVRDARNVPRALRPALWGVHMADIYLRRLRGARFDVFDARLRASMAATYPLRLQMRLLAARMFGRI